MLVIMLFTITVLVWSMMLVMLTGGEIRNSRVFVFSNVYFSDAGEENHHQEEIENELRD